MTTIFKNLGRVLSGIPNSDGTTLVPSTTADTKIQRQYAREQGKKGEEEKDVGAPSPVTVRYVGHNWKLSGSADASDTERDQLQTSAFENNPYAETDIFNDMQYESTEQSDDDDEDSATTDSEFPVHEETQISVPVLLEHLETLLKKSKIQSKIQSDYINKLEGDLETAHAEIDALEVELKEDKAELKACRETSRNNEREMKNLREANMQMQTSMTEIKKNFEACLQRQRELQQAQNVLEKEKTECAAELKKHASQLRGTRSNVAEEDEEGEEEDVHDADEETLEHSAKRGKRSRDWGCVLKKKINNGLRDGCRKISGTTNIDKGCTTIKRRGMERCALLKKKK